MTPDVRRQLRDRRVATGAILVHRLHHDPVQVATQLAHQRPWVSRSRLRDGVLQAGRLVGGRRRLGAERRPLQQLETCARPRRLDMLDRPQDLGRALGAKLDGIKGQHARQKLVEQHAERVNVGSRVDPTVSQLGLLGAHVLRRPDQLPLLGKHRSVRQLARRRLGDAEIDHLRDRLAVLQRHENVVGLDVAMDHALLVRVLHRVAHLKEELQPIHGRETPLVAKAGQRKPFDVLHHEVGPPLIGHAGVDHAGDVRVIE